MKKFLIGLVLGIIFTTIIVNNIDNLPEFTYAFGDWFSKYVDGLEPPIPGN